MGKRIFGELELTILNVFQKDGSIRTVRDVLQALGREDKYTTIMTVLDRLGTKEMVRRERDGRACQYAPALSRDEATSELLHAALDEAGTDRTAALVHFARTVDPDEAKALRAALDEIVARTAE